MKTLLFISTLLLSFFNIDEEVKKISVQIEGIETTEGKIILSAFKTNEQFQDELPILNFNVDKSLAVNGKIHTTIQLPYGNWGLTLLDDENNDDEMEYNFIGIPEEGFGFSNYYLSGLSKPDLEDFDFEVTPTDSLEIKIKIRYM